MKRYLLAFAIIASPCVAFAAPTKEQCIATNAHAQELRQAGKLHEALAELDQCIDTTCPELVRADCAERVDEIRRAMPTVVFDVKTTAGVDLVDAHVDMDGHTLRERLDGRPVAIDPGDHTFVISAHGSSQTVHVLVHEGEKDRSVSASFAQPPPALHASPLRPIGVTLAGVGLAALALGATTGALTLAEHGDVASKCPNNVCPDQTTKDSVASKNADSQTLATVSTIGFVASVVLLTTGVLMYALAPRSGVRVGLGFVSGTF